MWYAGWDGGGTKTEVCILDGEGKLLAKRVFGPLNPNGTDPERVRQTVREGHNTNRRKRVWKPKRSSRAA